MKQSFSFPTAFLYDQLSIAAEAMKIFIGPYVDCNPKGPSAYAKAKMKRCYLITPD